VDKSTREAYFMKLQYYIKGMDCAEEVALLKRELVPLVGEESIAFDLLNAKLTVTTKESTNAFNVCEWTGWTDWISDRVAWKRDYKPCFVMVRKRLLCGWDLGWLRYGLS
jgi:copper chaperone CopZ